jgi:hypothetical protein
MSWYGEQKLLYYCDTEDYNKLQVYEVVEYFKSQINKDGK